MPQYQHPGVYVEELRTFPPSVAGVATAIPAFIGYTQFATQGFFKPLRITSLLEYEEFFGTYDSNDLTISVTLDENLAVESASIYTAFHLYHSLQLYFANGGGPCYIVSIGSYAETTALVLPDFLAGLDSLLAEDEVTILLFPDAVGLSLSELSRLQAASLSQCAKLGDRVGVLDVKFNDPTLGRSLRDEVLNFRNGIGNVNLKYGAAYAPYLKALVPITPYLNHIQEILRRTRAGLSPITLEELSPGSEISRLIESIRNILLDLNTDASPGDPLDGIRDFIQTPYELSSFSIDTVANPWAVNSLYDGYFQIPSTNDEVELQLRIDYIRAVLLTFRDLTPNTTAGGSFHDASIGDQHAQILLPTDNSGITDAERRTYQFSPYEIAARTLSLYYDALPSPLSGTITFDRASDFASMDPSVFDNSYGRPVNVDIYGTSTTATDQVIASRAAFENLYLQALSIVEDFWAFAEQRLENQEQVLRDQFPLYGNMIRSITQQGLLTPPSGAVVGIYASVDRERGVFKAPANVSIQSVIGPAIKITDEEQDNLNVDSLAGKSVNAIRSFTGRGTLVWGARTLAGNDNEWRYVPVRRFFQFCGGVHQKGYHGICI